MAARTGRLETLEWRATASMVVAARPVEAINA